MAREHQHPHCKRPLLAMLIGAAMGLTLSCGSTGSAPLGGPYGGKISPLAPTDGGFSTVDATIAPPSPSLGPGGPSGDYGTWTHLFNTYLAASTVGNCTQCHRRDMSNASASYKYLKDGGYVGGPSPLLTSMGASCLSWYGGDMPPRGPKSHADAMKEFDSWAAVGGRNN